MDENKAEIPVLKTNAELENIIKESETSDVVYSSYKDFYKGAKGELRFKAEGLFKKAKEKGLSIEEINIATLKENSVDFPGIGTVELPTYVVKVRGRDMSSNQVIVDGKQIDYFNRYQRYLAEKIWEKNVIRDEKGKILREKGRPAINKDIEYSLSDWEMFEIGKSLVEDKEFGLEKTITGACDRVIRKLMGENDWLYPEEARLLDEEFERVQEKIESQGNMDNEEYKGEKSSKPFIKTGERAFDRAADKTSDKVTEQKKATERQINYLKAKLKNAGIDPDNSAVIKEILRQGGFKQEDVSDLSTLQMSKLIENITSIIPKVKDELKLYN